MVDAISALLGGALLPLLPALLLQTLRRVPERSGALLWGALALLAWCGAFALALLELPLALLGLVLGAGAAWFLRDRPDFKVSE